MVKKKKPGVFSTEKFFEGVFRSDRATLFHRILARGVDLFVAFFLATGFVYPAGPIFALSYVLVGDALFSGQSIGKRLIGLKVIELNTNEPVSFQKSAIRNLPFGTAFFFALIPFWGWIICLIVGLPLLILEFTLIMRLSSGFRLGDVMADTAVIHGPSLWRDWRAYKVKKERVERRAKRRKPPKKTVEKIPEKSSEKPSDKATDKPSK